MSLSKLRTGVLNRIAKSQLKVSMSTVKIIANTKVDSKEEYCKSVADALIKDDQEGLAAEFLRILEPKEEVKTNEKEGDSKES